MNLRTATRSFRHRFDRHKPLITIALSRENLLHNLHTYQAAYPGLTFAPVLKSNAYGHGLVPIAQMLDTENTAFFMVDSYFEARSLRRSGIRTRIAVIGYVQPEEIATSSLPDTDYAIVDIEQLRELSRMARKEVSLHIKVDTGMHRQGLLPQELPEAIQLISSNPRLSVVGICSHLADADSADSDTHSHAQLAVWKQAASTLTTAFPSIIYRHLSATKGVRFSEEAGTTVGRLGIGLYGVDTSPQGTIDLRPVLEMRTRISSLRTIPPGDFVGYNATHVAQAPETIATIPTGYYEGIDRALSNVGSVRVQSVPCPIVGRVSMNMASIDVSSVPGVARGDEVIVISREPSHDNSIQSMARLIGTSPYVLLVHIPQHLKRVIE
jgi:alanine racemase